MFNIFWDFFFGRTVTRDMLGNLPASPYADKFKPPAYDKVSEMQQGLAPEEPTQRRCE